MDDLVKILERSVSSNQADQNEAVKYIQDFCQKDFTGIMQALSDVLHNQQNPPVVRAAAGLQLKNQLTARDENLRQQQQDRWRSLPESTRLHIKDRVFKALGTEIFRPSSAPQCVAYIALIELPNQQWPGLIPALAANVTSPTSTQPLKLASLEAIGYICQEIDQHCNRATSSNHTPNSMGLRGMKQDEIDEVKLAATTALLASLEFTETNFNAELERAATAALVNLFESKIKKISNIHQKLTFVQLGELLGNLEPQCAERVMAQMIREERVQGHLNQIEGVVYFESKDVLRVFDDEILVLCSDVNKIIEKIKNVVPDEWWS